MNQIKISLDDHEFKVTALKIGNTLWVHHQGECFAIEKVDGPAKRRGQGASADASGEIRAPMPGKISKVKVQKGHQVQAGDVLIVMEAMKMEYTLKAPFAGLVKEVLCQDGQQVSLGETLVLLIAPTAKDPKDLKK